MARTKKEEPMLSTAEVAEYLNIDILTLLKWIRNGDLKASQLSPKLYRVKRTDLDAFVESHTVGTKQ